MWGILVEMMNKTLAQTNTEAWRSKHLPALITTLSDAIKARSEAGYSEVSQLIDSRWLIPVRGEWDVPELRQYFTALGFKVRAYISLQSSCINISWSK